MLAEMRIIHKANSTDRFAFFSLNICSYLSSTLEFNSNSFLGGSLWLTKQSIEEAEAKPLWNIC